MTDSSAYSALADPTRRAILARLGHGSLPAGEIAAAFDLSKPTISHHLKVLVSAGLVRSERRGTSIVYTLQTNVLEDIARTLLDLVPSNRAGSSPASNRAGSSPATGGRHVAR